MKEASIDLALMVISIDRRNLQFIAAIMAVRYQQFGEYRIARNVPEAR
jgi:hypothetical protein